MTDTKKKLQPKASPERIAKESSALRENLRKRKQQQAARQTDKKGN